MSIFKDTFKPEIQEQLKARQEAIFERTPAAIQYYNARNAWVRMTSAVNVNNDDGDLASKYVLAGGTLSYDSNTKQYSLKSGIGTNNAYSNFTPANALNRLGIRPMPGITSIEVKSKSAYGSLREVVVNFNAWDIRQLEELELLYMRPGYTVLVEWGWAPYLDNNKQLQNNVDFYDIIHPVKGLTKEQIFKDIFNKSANAYKGNYDAMYGYIKNYSWSARSDGGYDCTTTIISIGEVLESLKINYAPLDDIKAIETKGLIASRIEGVDILAMTDLSKAYSLNILAGLFYEMYQIGMQKMPNTVDTGKSFVIKDVVNGSTSYYDLFKKTINIKGGGDKEASSDNKIGASDEQIYITLETLCNLINNYVVFKDSNGNSSYIKCSVLERNYDKTTPITPNPINGDGYLLSLAHPLQLSIDPTVCVIKSPLWASGFKVDPSTIFPAEATGSNITKYSNTNYTNLFNKLIEFGANTNNADEEKIVNEVVVVTRRQTNEFKELNRQFLQIKTQIVDKGLNTIPPEFAGLKQSFVNYVKNKRFNNFYNLLDDSLNSKELNLILIGREFRGGADLATPEAAATEAKLYEDNLSALTLTPIEATNRELNNLKSELVKVQSDTKKALGFLNNIPRPYFYKDNYQTELGIIGNIYVNLNYLYRLAIDNNLESQDKKEKNDINLYDFLKKILADISSVTGNVSNLDLHIDPIDNNIIRIIDVNYADNESREKIYEKAFQFEIHNTKSIIRNYKLESQIFPDQSTIISIGAQVEGGALATDNNTMLNFNKGLTDRIIPKKENPTTDSNLDITEKTKSQVENIIASLKSLYTFFGDLKYNWFFDADYDVNQANNYKNSLKDLINYFKNLTNSDIKNRAIIPTKLSLEIDGIGGLVIGHIFKIPDDILPKGYKGGALGSKTGYVITGIGHNIKNNDWVTNIDSQIIILDNPSGGKINFNDLIKLDSEITPSKKASDKITNIPKTQGTNSEGDTKVICGVTRKNGDIEDLLINIRKDLYVRHYSPINQSDNRRIRLQPNAIKDLEKLLTDAYKAGIYIKVNSAYRTYSDQVRIKNQSTNIPAATPGTSNHGFGLAVDLGNRNGIAINPTKTPKEWQWIQANKNKYGFENINNNNESHHYNYIKPGINC